jgi:dephospho-CoA kinase
LGETLINNGLEEFCRSVIKQAVWKPGQSLVIDGIRHHDVLNKLKEIVRPSSFVLVYISVNEDNRLRRIAQRDGLSQNEACKVDEHSTEKDTKLVLTQLADIKIIGEQPIEMAVKEISNHLSHLLKQEE